MSFFLTTRQYLDQSKDVTRRLGWMNLKANDIFNGVEKSQGLKKGEKVNQLGQNIVISARRERLDLMLTSPPYGEAEVIREGFPELSPKQFVEMFCDTHKNCEPGTTITRIEFGYLLHKTSAKSFERCNRTQDMFGNIYIQPVFAGL